MVKKLLRRLASRKTWFLEHFPRVDGHGMGATSLAGDSIYIAFMCIDGYLNVVVLCILDMTISAKSKWRHA